MSLTAFKPRITPEWKTESPEGLAFLEKLKRAAQTELSLYLDGETGVGKELLAHQIHLSSKHPAGPFVALHCGGLSDTLADSELFGHLKGAYTGAIRDRKGALMAADGGTLFLDEVADLSPELQVKLLRFLESGEIRQVGSDLVRHAKVRIICATHLNLSDLVNSGKFRRDLYFRIASIPLKIPPLRERKSDILMLAQQFSEKSSVKITPSAAKILLRYSWPGNVRELKHALERAIAFREDSDSLYEGDFDFLFAQSMGTATGAPLRSPYESAHLISQESSQIRKHETVITAFERDCIVRALAHYQGNRTQTALALGIARSTLFEKMKRYQLLEVPIKIMNSNLSSAQSAENKPQGFGHEYPLIPEVHSIAQ